MELISITERTTLIDPGGNRAEQTIEQRIDPLTGNVASVNLALGEKARAFLGTADVELLRDFETRSKAGCPFCSAKEKGTRFLPDLIEEGQLRIGRALAFPNLFSKCRYDSVVIVDPERHVLFPSQLAREALGDAIRVCAELARRTRAREPSLVHHLAGMNFLQPGGSSVPHPHFQMHVRSVPFSGVARVVERSEEYWRAHGRSFWDEMLDEEGKIGARYVGSTGSVDWIAAFAPAHQKEFWGVLRSTGSLAEIDDRAASSFADGLSRVLSFYESSGVHPFTFAFFSSPRAGSGPFFSLHVRICARPPFRNLYANFDSWFGPKLVGDEAHTEPPERYAEQLRAIWSRR
jgi:galactose-1-phosphate uridylyltransferase